MRRKRSSAGRCHRFCFSSGAGVCSLRTETPPFTRKREAEPDPDDGGVDVIAGDGGWGRLRQRVGARVGLALDPLERRGLPRTFSGCL